MTQITLPTFEQLRDYYASLSPGEQFHDYDYQCCLIARPLNERRVEEGKPIIGISPSEDDRCAEITFDDVGDHFVAEPLPPMYNRLALAFDRENAAKRGEHITYGQCVTLIERFIAIEKQEKGELA
jgi:hypothetical protein